MKLSAIKIITSLLFLVLATASFAQSAPQADARKAELTAAFADAEKVKQVGPTEVTLIDQARLKIPAGEIFIPMPAAGRLIRAMGNSADSSLLGVIFPEKEQGWLVVAHYEKAGYIKDDDAKEWNADELLKSLTDGTEAANADRRSRGIPEIAVTGWAEKPAYEAINHRLVWSAITKDKGGSDDDLGVNFNTYALGRDGYISLNLVTSLKDLPTQKTVAHELLGNLEFNDGKRYADFNASTDKVAEYGLAALVAGVAAKKLGFFAIALAFLAKFAKLGFIALVGIGAVVRKWLGRPQAEPIPATPIADVIQPMNQSLADEMRNQDAGTGAQNGSSKDNK